MVKKPFRGNYLELKVRVSYDEKTDSIHITSKDKDLPTTRGFHLSLNGGRDAEYTLRTLLEEHGLIPEDRFKAIPEMARFTDAINIDKWDEFPLGLFANGDEAVWNTHTSPNLLIAGAAGTGKSVIQRNIIFHCLRHSEKWAFFGIDLKQVELVPYLKFGDPITEVATTVAAAHETVQKAYDEMRKRYRTMDNVGVNHFRDLSDTPRAWMIMIDESLMLLSESYSKTDEGKAENLLRNEIQDKLSRIAQLGRAAGIHLVMATQRVDAHAFYGAFKQSFTTRIAAGGMDALASQALLDNDEATHLNRAIKGRGYLQQINKGADFQSYFSEFHWPYDSGIVSRDQ